jgi:predicted transcriptional regulator
MAAGADQAGAALRVTLARLLDTDSPVPSAEHAGAAAVAEVLVAYEEARRVRAERDRQARACRPLVENIMVELVHRGPLTAAELAAATHVENDRVRSALRRLTRDGLVQPAATGQGRPRHHELSPAGVNAAMAG